MHMNSKMGQRKNQNPPRRHGEDQNQFSPERTQRSRATTKTILYQRGHEGTRREPKPKLTAEVAKEAQRAQSRTAAIKICAKNEEILRLVLRRRSKTKINHSVTEPQPKTKTHHGGTETRRKSKPFCH